MIMVSGLVLMIAVNARSESTVQYGLDSKKAETREKTPVIVYLGNDIMAPLNINGINQNSQYLENGLAGKQYYASTSPYFSKEDVDSFTSFSEEEQTFLNDVATWVPHDISQSAVTTDERTLRVGICRTNPKYRSALVVLRNFRQNGQLGAKNQIFKWEHCGPDLEKDDTSFIRDVDVSSLKDTLYQYPYSEQPLTHAGLVKLLLKEIATLYPPKQYRYLIVIHSNSTKDYVLSPQHSLRFRTLPIQKVRQAVINHRQQFVDGKGQLRKDRSFFVALNESILSVDPALKPALGISASELLNILEHEIEGLEVPFVLLDTNALDFSELKKEKLRNVGTVYYSTNPAPQDWVLDWRQLFYYVGVKSNELEDRMRELFR